MSDPVTSATGKLVDLLINFLGLFKFWVVLDEYQQGVKLTLGRPRGGRKAVLGPGFHLIWPLGIDQVIEDNVVPASLDLPVQTVSLNDGTTISIQCSLVWSISDIYTFELKVEGAEALLQNVAGIVKQWLSDSSCDDVFNSDLEQHLLAFIHNELPDWGAEIEEVYVNTLTCTGLREGIIRMIND